MKNPKKKNSPKTYAIYLLIFAVLVGIFYIAYNSFFPTSRIGALGSQHIHADFKLYINNQAVNFTQSKYQLDYGSSDQYVHMEGGDGNIIHVHATGIILNDWLNSINIYINSTCLTMDDGTNYCNSPTTHLRMYVGHCSPIGTTNTTCSSWQQVSPVAADYTIQDLDKILISYGSDNPSSISAQQNSVTNEAVLHSYVSASTG